MAVDVEQGHIEVPGGRVWYRRIGDGPGVPLLLLHGGPGSSSLGQELWLGDLPSQRPVFLYDQLGSGNSDKPDDPSLWRVERFVEEVAAVRAALDLEEVCLLGQSWGSMLAAAYLATGPSRVRAVVFSSPCLDAVQWEADQRALLAQMPEDVQATVERCEREGTTDSSEYEEATLAYYRRHLCRLDPWPDILQQVIAGMNRQVYGLMWGASEFTVTGTLREFDARPWLPDLDMPVLFTCGEHDEARPETVDRQRSLVSGAAMHVFEGASHTATLEVPDAYRAVVSGFLAEEAGHEGMQPERRHRLIESVRERRERHRERSRVVRAAVVLAGFVVVLVGLALIPLPGPGLLVIAVGLAVLALEFAWAERLLERTVERMGQATEKVKCASRAQQILLGLLGVLIAAAAITAAYAWDVPLLPV